MKKAFGFFSRNTFISLLLIFSVFSCASNENAADKTKVKKISSLIKSMSVEEKVGQLFVVRPEQIDPEISLEQLRMSQELNVSTTAVTDKIRINYQKYPVCGFAIFDQNIKSPEQLKLFTSELHKLGNNGKYLRPYIFIDEEGGIVARIGNRKAFNVPRTENMGIVARNKKSLEEKKLAAYGAGKSIGAYLREYDIDVDFAPVCDVNTNPGNPVIGTRAFSSDPEIAGALAVDFLKGLREYNIEGCLKHFPGHGDTSTDTHLGFAESEKSWEELSECEMIPFVKGIDAGAVFIMTAHISLPEYTGDSVPATLSYKILTEKLRNELGFKGIIITDAMEMGAIHKGYNSGEAAVKAILAGADIILMPYDFEAAFVSVVQAVKAGKIPEKRINQSLERILAVKL